MDNTTVHDTKPTADFSSETGDKNPADNETKERTGSADDALDGINVGDGINDKEGSLDNKFDSKFDNKL